MIVALALTLALAAPTAPAPVVPPMDQGTADVICNSFNTNPIRALGIPLGYAAAYCPLVLV